MSIKQKRTILLRDFHIGRILVTAAIILTATAFNAIASGFISGPGVHKLNSIAPFPNWISDGKLVLVRLSGGGGGGGGGDEVGGPNQRGGGGGGASLGDLMPLPLKPNHFYWVVIGPGGAGGRFKENGTDGAATFLVECDHDLSSSDQSGLAVGIIPTGGGSCAKIASKDGGKGGGSGNTSTKGGLGAGNGGTGGNGVGFAQGEQGDPNSAGAPGGIGGLPTVDNGNGSGGGGGRGMSSSLACTGSLCDPGKGAGGTAVHGNRTAATSGGFGSGGGGGRTFENRHTSGEVPDMDATDAVSGANGGEGLFEYFL